MERLQGRINPCFTGEEHLAVELLEKENTNKSLAFSSYGQFVSAERSSRFQVGGGGPGHLSRNGSLELDKMPFLEMLQSVESSQLCELSFEDLLNLQQCKKAGDEIRYTPEVIVECSRHFPAEVQPSSCLTHDVLEVRQYSQDKSKTNDHLQVHYPQYSTTCGGVSSSGRIAINQDLPYRPVDGGEGNKSSSSSGPRERSVSPKRKRIKKTRPTKKKEEVESQRMIHIVVERNRRRQMNNHLSALRSLMPSTYIRRGDQASIIGGAIDFVKELEQLLLSLQGQKRIRKLELSGQARGDTVSSSTSSSAATVSVDQRRRSRFDKPEVEAGNCGRSSGWEGIITSKSNDQLTAEKKSEVVEVKVRVIQNHVNLNVECPKRAGQLLKAIDALDDLRLTVLHLNVTSFQTRVHYSFNLKIEDECDVGSAAMISVAVHQIFSFVNNGT